MRNILLTLSLLFAGLLPAQTSFTLSGYVKDMADGEAMIGATVQCPELKIGAYANEYGYYSLRIPGGDSVTVEYSYVGYGTVSRRLLLKADMRLDIELSNRELEDVLITADPLKEKLESTQMSVDEITMVEAKQLPALFGEVDIIKTLQLKPGVQSGGEGTSGIYVRGGGPDQNLILLDEAPVYNPNHLFGFFSTFNSDAVKDVRLFKGGFPAEYGGKLSSVIDVRLNEGNRKRFAGAGGIGLIASRLTLEGPIVKDKSSFMISGRRTYFDIITRGINKAKEGDENFDPIPDYYFYDLNAKVNYTIGEKDEVFLSGYFGRDVFGFNSGDFDFNFNWGNSTGTLRWNHLFSPRLFLKTVATFSDYEYSIKNQFNVFNFELGSGIRDFNLKSELSWMPNTKHTVRAGINGIAHRFEIGRLNAGTQDSTINFQAGNIFHGNEFGAYISDEAEISSRLKMNGGLRLSGFQNDSSLFFGLEPRLSARYLITENLTAKASYTRMFQYVHLVSNSGASLPTDVWYPSNELVQPQRSDQVAAGLSILLFQGKLLLTDEVYYKWLKQQVDFRDGAQLFVNPNLDEEFVFGKGWSYGNEVYLEKKLGKLTGWVGYTLSWSWREFPDIMEGQKFHPRYDRRHDVSVVSMYQLNKRVSITGSWVYGTGQAISLPIGRFLVQDAVPGADPQIVPVFTERNGFRMPAYHRMDLGLVYRFFPKWGESDLTFSIYNVYNRRNAYFIYFDTVNDEDGNPVRFEARQVSLFPIIPSITFNFKF